jgi:hypothetical protein
MSWKSTHLIDLAPISFVCRHTSDTSETSKEPFGKSVEQIKRQSLFQGRSFYSPGRREAEELLRWFPGRGRQALRGDSIA